MSVTVNIINALSGETVATIEAEISCTVGMLKTRLGVSVQDGLRVADLFQGTTVLDDVLKLEDLASTQDPDSVLEVDLQARMVAILEPDRYSCTKTYYESQGCDSVGEIYSEETIEYQVVIETDGTFKWKQGDVKHSDDGEPWKQGKVKFSDSGAVTFCMDDGQSLSHLKLEDGRLFWNCKTHGIDKWRCMESTTLRLESEARARESKVAQELLAMGYNPQSEICQMMVHSEKLAKLVFPEKFG